MPATELRKAPAVESVNPPVVRMPVLVRPLTWVEVPADVLKILPAVTVNPLEEERPAEERAPESAVLVPATVEIMLPPVMVMPCVEASPPWPASTVPLENVLVAVLVCNSEPPVMVRPFWDKRPVALIPPLKVEVAVDEAMLRIPEKVDDALSESMAKMGAVIDVPVAMVKAYLVFAGMVVVAER